MHRTDLSIRLAGLPGLEILLSAIVFVFVACDAGDFGEGPAKICTEVAVQCVLAEGPLGVCERTPCRGSAVEPCFVCTPQH